MDEMPDWPINGIGAALYLASSLINHSCVPNMYLVNYGSTAVYRAMRPIKKGEQLTECYYNFFDLNKPLQDRQTFFTAMKFQCR